MDLTYYHDIEGSPCQVQRLTKIAKLNVSTALMVRWRDYRDEIKVILSAHTW